MSHVQISRWADCQRQVAFFNFECIFMLSSLLGTGRFYGRLRVSLYIICGLCTYLKDVCSYYMYYHVYNSSYSRSKAARRRLKKALTSVRFISSLRWAMFNQVTPCKIVYAMQIKRYHVKFYTASLAIREQFVMWRIWLEKVIDTLADHNAIWLVIA